jgi:PST family polysaccharide transporter
MSGSPTDTVDLGDGPAPESQTSLRTREEVAGSAIRAVVWNGLQLWGYNIVGLGVFVALGRLLSPRDFGLAASAMVVIWFLRIIVDAGFSRLLVQRPDFDRIFADTAFWTAGLLGLAFAVVTFAAAPLCALLFGQPGLTPLVRALSVIFIFVGIDSTPTALLQRELKWRALATRRLSATAVSAPVAIGLALSGAGAWALVGQQLVLEGLTMLLLWFLMSWRPRFQFSRSAFRELFQFGSRYSILRIFTYLGTNVDNLLIGVFLGPVALGYYVVAYRIFTVLNELCVTTIQNVALPAFSRLQGDRRSLNEAFYRASASAALLSVPAYAGLAVVSAQLVPAVFGHKWHTSVPVLELLTLAGVAQAQLAFTSSYVVAIGLIRREVPWTIGLTMTELIGFAAAVHFGIVAVAAALAIVLVVAWPVRLLFLRAWGGISLEVYLRSLLPTITATAAMAAVILPLHLWSPLPTGWMIALEVMAGLITYPLAMYLVAPTEVRRIRRQLRQARGKSPA